VQSSARLKSHEEPETEKPEMRYCYVATARRAQYYRYVPHEDVAAYEANGWGSTPALVGTPHGKYSTLMCYLHDGEPPNE
jgi:hypothetical protein